MNNAPVDMGGFSLASDAPLGGRNTLRVDARAKLLAEVRDPAKIPELLAYPAVKAGKLLVLGEGSNLLIKGDFDGTVLAMATRGVETFQRDDRVLIRVAAGERWDDFVRWSLGQGYAGLENPARSAPLRSRTSAPMASRSRNSSTPWKPGTRMPASSSCSTRPRAPSRTAIPASSSNRADGSSWR
jgi:hypothetical protein